MRLERIITIREFFRRRVLLRDTIITTGWGGVGKIAGFMIPFFIAAWFGISEGTDAFFFVYGIILFFAGIFAPVVESVIVPFVADQRKKGGDVGAFVGRIFLLSGSGLLVLLIAVLILIRPVLSLVTRFDPETLRTVFQLMLISSPLVILLVWTSILCGVLNAYKKFAFPAVSPAFRAVLNLGLIYILKERFGVYAIAIGYVGGELLRLLILFLVFKRKRIFRLRFFRRLSPGVVDFLRTASYQTLGMAVVWANPLVDRAMASWLGGGSVSILYYSDRLFMVPVSLIFVGLFPVVLSHWSSDYYEAEARLSLLRKVNRTALAVIGLCCLLVAVLAFFSGPLVQLAFVRGKLDPASAIPIRTTFLYYLPGLISYVAGSLFMRAHLVLKNTVLIMRLCVLNFFLHIGLNYILMRWMGVAGIALSTTITFTVLALLFYFRLRARIKLTRSREEVSE